MLSTPETWLPDAPDGVILRLIAADLPGAMITGVPADWVGSTDGRYGSPVSLLTALSNGAVEALAVSVVEPAGAPPSPNGPISWTYVPQ